MDRFVFALATIVLLQGAVVALPGTPIDASGHFTSASTVPLTSSGGTLNDPALIPPYQQYSYYGERYRDPFIPLTGQTMLDTNDHAPQTSTLALKGIIQDTQGRMALLASGMSSYILKGGRLYDGRNKIVKGISGVIKKDSVVVVGADRAVRELKVKAAL